jgi:rubrerythrin
MATGETGFDDVSFDLISIQYHALKAGHDYGQYVRDAENAGMNDLADFFREVMEADSQRAQRCHEFLARISNAEPARS